MKKEQLTKDEIVRAAVEFILAITEPVKVWHPVLFDNTNSVPEWVRDRAFPIYFCCLLDVAEAPKKYLSRLQSEATAYQGLLSRNIRELALQCSFAAETLNGFSEDEQIFLTLVRNRFVHGYLDGTTRDEIREFRVVKNGLVTKLKRNKFDREKLIRVFPPNTGTVAGIREKHDHSMRSYSRNVEELFFGADILTEALLSNGLLVADNKSVYRKIGD